MISHFVGEADELIDPYGRLRTDNRAHEVIGVCDRVMIMHEGKLTGELTGKDLTEENIIKLATAV